LVICPHFAFGIHTPMRWFWLDRFSEFVSGSHAIAVKCVSLSEDHLRDNFPGYPLMPNTLVAEGMAQCGGLLVSEIYQFSELVVLAKFSKMMFEGEARPGDTIRFHAVITQAKEEGASVEVKGDIDGRPFCASEIFFARFDADSTEHTKGRVLFNPADLLSWLNAVNVFQIGIHADGTRMRVDDYPALPQGVRKTPITH
jgi:3-hydroxyacyl-[acyl-carrier-protein] dehydratase